MSMGTRGDMTKFDYFMNHFVTGRAKLIKAVEIDEEFDDSCKDKKLQACELYKQGMDEFKKAEKINTMDITPERRKEVADAKEKMKGYSRMAKMERSNVPVHSSSLAGSSNTRVASPSGRGRRVNQVPPVIYRFGNSGQRIPSRQQLLNGVDAKFGERLLDEMLDRTGVKLSDVVGCEAAKEALEEAVILPAMNPVLFSGLRQPVKGILLFGPPGNGKTLLAKAVASESNQVFFNISAASLTSKWVGDSEKTIRSLFQIAKNAQPAIIFIGKFGHFLENEIDSILCDRSEKDTEVSRRMKTEFLLQFDGATSSPDDRVLVIGATNRPYELDDAVLRRFPKRIHLGLPDGESRFTLLKAILDKHNMSAGLTDYDIRKIASKTDGYSNSDLVALCKEAAMVPIRSIDREKLATCDESKLRKLKSSDFDKALTVIRPSSNERSLQCLSDFWRRAGQ
ncbi:hypothetical protein Angca_005796, partial [Angiostrongylus cantonensis]